MRKWKSYFCGWCEKACSLYVWIEIWKTKYTEYTANNNFTFSAFSDSWLYIRVLYALLISLFLRNCKRDVILEIEQGVAIYMARSPYKAIPDDSQQRRPQASYGTTFSGSNELFSFIVYYKVPQFLFSLKSGFY